MKKLFSSIPIFVLSAALLTMLLLYGEQQKRLEAQAQELNGYRVQLQNGAEQSAHALSDALRELEGNVRKLSVSNDAAHKVRLLGEIRRLSDRAGGALSSLAVSQADGGTLSQFLTRTGDYANTLLGSLQGGDALPEDDLAQLGVIGMQCDALIDVIGERLSSGYLPIEAVTTDRYYTASQNAETLPAYPTLAYDGAYSERSETAAPKDLPQGTVTEAEAAQIAAAFSDTAWQSDGFCDGTIPCYLFSGPLGESLSISRQGGKILLWREQATTETDAPPQQAQLAAMQSAAGFSAMQPTLWQRSGGTVALQFVPVQDGIVLYPDLVVVYVEQATDAVIGFDATGYYLHHTDRAFAAPQLSEDDVLRAVSSALTVENVTLCCLAKSNTQELLCYECSGTLGEIPCRVYCSAETGAEETILLLETSETGQMLR